MKMLELRNLMVDYFGKSIDVKHFDDSECHNLFFFRDNFIDDNGKEIYKSNSPDTYVLKPHVGKFYDLEVSHLTLIFNESRKAVAKNIKHIFVYSYLSLCRENIDTERSTVLTMWSSFTIRAPMQKIREFSVDNNLMWKIEYDYYDWKIPVEYHWEKYDFDCYMRLIKYLRKEELVEFLEDRRKHYELVH